MSSRVVKRLEVVDVDDDFFDAGLDAIEAQMKDSAVAPEADRREFVVTSDELTQIVNDAVAHAIAAYERARNRPTPQPTLPPPIKLVPYATRKLERLQDEMGLGDIEFEAATPEVSSTNSIENTDLSTEMGVDGFAFEQLPDLPARPVEVAPLTLDQKTAAALSEWDAALKRLLAEPTEA